MGVAISIPAATEAMLAMKALTSQVLTLSSSSATSTVLTASRVYRIAATEACWIRQGASTVVAVENTAGSTLIPAGAVEYITADDATTEGYLAAIEADTNGGYLSITLMR